MGKASKWFRGLLGLKTPDSSSPKPPKEKRRWSFVKSYKEKDNNHLATTTPVVEAAGNNKHAALAELAIAAATSAMAEARLTTVTATAGAVTAGRQEWAALKIQAAFRGCLARKALRALKGLVKLQALVRGHIERKRTTEWVQRVQALLRAQARARVARAQILDQASYWSSAKSYTGPLHGPATPEKFESPVSSESMKYGQSSSTLKRNGSKSCARINGNQENGGTRSDNRVDEQSWTQQRRSGIMRTCSMDDETSFTTLDVDPGKPRIRSKRRNLFYSSSQVLLPDQYSQSLTPTKDSTSSCEIPKMNDAEENSYQEVLSASSKDGCSKKSPLTTPTKSDGSRSYLSGYNADCYPSYMAYTESSKAKLRSLSAPKQRPAQYERSSSSKLATQRIATLHASFTSKAYPGSGRLDKLGLPIGYSF